MVGRTGFEPVKAQGRLIYSQLRLTASLPTHLHFWSRCAGSNRRPSPYHGDALPTELQRLGIRSGSCRSPPPAILLRVAAWSTSGERHQELGEMGEENAYNDEYGTNTIVA